MFFYKYTNLFLIYQPSHKILCITRSIRKFAINKRNSLEIDL
jgi:hypothetical protein